MNAAPPWFELSRYAPAATLGAAGWYLNLKVRIELSHAKPGALWSAALLKLLREARPVLEWPEARTLPPRNAMFDALELAGLDESDEMPDEVAALLDGRPPKAGVVPLHVAEMYHFERLLPGEVRERGRRGVLPHRVRLMVNGRPTDGTLDEAFEPQFIGRFVRVDLGLPNARLIEDFQAWLRGQRIRMGELAGPQPYRQALERLKGRKAPRFKTFARLGVLALLDVDRWRAETGAKLTNEALSALIGIEPERLSEAREYAALLSDPWVVDAWLGGHVRARRTSGPG